MPSKTYLPLFDFPNVTIETFEIIFSLWYQKIQKYQWVLAYSPISKSNIHKISAYNLNNH